MVETVRDIATRAGRKLGIIRAGGELKAADAQDMLASLISFYQECVTMGTFGRVQDVPISAAFTGNSGVNQHINILTEDAVEITLPSVVPYDWWDTWRPCRDYGWGLNVPIGGNNGDNVPPDRSVIRVTDQFSTTRASYVYDGTVQRWMRFDSLALEDEAPLSARGADGLAAVLAERVADEFGSEMLSPLTMRAARAYRVGLVTHYGKQDDCYHSIS